MAEIIGRVGIRNYVSPIPQASTLINGLIHAWNANGNANDSIGGLNGTLVNGALADAAPKIGSGAFYFDGINDRITLADNSLNLTTDFTVSFWCKDGVGSNKTIIHNKYFANDANTSGWSIIYNGTGISFDITTVEVRTADIRHLLPNWNHVVVKYTRGVKMEIFLNGVLNATKNTTLTPTYSYTPIKTSIGTWNSVYMINGGPTLYPVTGLLDALNIWNRALTSAEITELYGMTTELQAPTPTYPTSLKFFIDAGNPLSYSGTGTTVTDLTGTQNGTLLNGTSYSSVNGGTFVFDGVNDYISFPTNSANLTGDFSISIAFNSAINNGNFVLFTNYLYSGGVNYGYKIALRDDNVIRFAIYNGGSGALNLVSTTTYSPNVWYHVVITRKSGNRTRMYINGVINSSDTNTIDPVYIGTNYPTVGVSQYQSGVFEQYSNAKIQKIGIFDKELTESEVLTDFNQFKSRYGY